MASSVQVLGISNAVVDVLAHVDDDFLGRIAAPKRSMILIDEQRAQHVYSMMGPATEMSGGSVANTIAGIANLGGTTAYIGRVADDQLGRIFVHDMQSLGVDVRLAPVRNGAPTARCYILITPDGERTMQTYLGACTELDGGDVNETTIGDPQVVLLEGYVWDIPQGPAAMAKAIRLARDKGAAVALSLSDAQCVARHREGFVRAVNEDVDIVFGNEAEVMSLFGVGSLDAVLQSSAALDVLFVITRSEKGSVIVDGSETVVQAAYPVEKLIDATGAGDAYTAAFLFGWTAGRSLAECADLGSRCATAVIQQIGARVEKGVRFIF